MKSNVLNNARRLWRKGLNLLPVSGFHFDRPLVLLQSDDWGRAGLRDREGAEQLRSAGIELGGNPYDFYTLETAEDVTALGECLQRHRDSTGRAPCFEMNFIQANLNFARMQAEDFRQIHVVPLSDGVPAGWSRPGLFAAIRDGIAQGIFTPALHGITHFCRRAVTRHLTDAGERGRLLRTLWAAGTPYIYWRMPWIGFEYWDPESEGGDFLTVAEQSELIGQAVGMFSAQFSALPHSACAPGYRANRDTHKAWMQYGIRIAQNGPGRMRSPGFDDLGMLHLYRTVECEPGVSRNFSLDNCISRAEACFARGIPAIISIHSINFHSSVRDFRSSTLAHLDQLLTALEQRHSDLLYVRDDEIHELVNRGRFENSRGSVSVNVVKKTSTAAMHAGVHC